MSDDALTHLPAASGLVLVPTPIGNLGDMSARALEALRSADAVLCEDTRVTGRLLAALGISASLSPLHDHNEQVRVPAVLAQLREGRVLALVADAGMPLLSDPGYRLVRAVLEADLPVHGLPGPHAATLALVLSGLPPHPYLFMGFPPPKQAARRAALATLRAAERAGLAATLLWHEAPHRLAETLADLLAVLGDRPAAVARELTKRFEEVRRGQLAALSAHYAEHAARGEIIVVVGAPAEADQGINEDAVEGALRAALEAGRSLKEAVADVTAATGRKRREVYALALRLDES
jgi:16S rRNA (cytidine1402-2'-O)-methyltransferase